MALNSKVAIEVEIKNIKQIADLKKELKELRKAQKDQEAESKSGRFQSKKSAKAYKERAKAIKENSKQLRTLNKDMAGATKSTKNITKSNNGMAKQFVKGAAAIGVIVGAFRTLNRAVSSVITTFSEFEFVMAKVNAVSGATNQEFAALNETAKELGRTTFFTASQVGELMLNFSKLGFTAQEIQDAVQPTLDLATATGSDLARAALVAGAAVRGFGLDASETQRVVDVMAVSFSSSAMNIEKWQTSMTKVAPIAKSAGFSIEDTAAIMSKLTDSGIEASIAGTSLRNILLKMQDPSSDLTKSFGRTIHGLDDLVPAMKKFVAEGGSMADVMEVVDLRQAAAFEQMLTTADGTLELRNALLDANGEGERMALIVGDTLQGSFLKFTSALQGFGISFMENFSGSLQKGIEDAAKFLNSLEKSAGSIASFVINLVKLVKFIGLYKAALIASTVATAAFEVATTKATFSTKRLMVSFRKLTATMMANPYVAVGALLVALATDMFGLRHEVNDTNESWERLNDTIKGDVNAYETRQKIIETLKGELATLQDLQRAKIAMSRIDDEIAAGQNSMAAIRADAIKNANSLFRESEQALKDAYIEQTMRDAQSNINLKDRQRGELKLAIAIAKKNIKAREGTIVVEENTKAIKENYDAEAEIVALLMNQGVRTKEEQARVTEYLNKLRQEEINLQLQSLNEFIMDVDLRKKLLLELAALQEKTDKAEQKRKDDSFEADVKRAIMSGQTAEEAMKTVVRAQIMEAVAGFIASIFKGVPFPVNLILAAGASAMVGNIIDSQLAKFSEGGVIETFANGGMVHGKSHEQGGEKFAVGGRVVELEGGEAVINKRSTAMFGSQLSAMNAAGGGVKFADGGLLNSPSFAQQQFSGNRSGGGGAQKVYVVESDISQSQNQVSVLEASATI